MGFEPEPPIPEPTSWSSGLCCLLKPLQSENCVYPQASSRYWAACGAERQGGLWPLEGRGQEEPWGVLQSWEEAGS